MGESGMCLLCEVGLGRETGAGGKLKVCWIIM